MADSYLQIDGIPGESLDDKHKDWIEILSFSHGITQPTSTTRSSAGGATTARSEHGDYVITKYLDKASPKLAEACSTGKHISKCKIEMCRAGGSQVPYLVVNLEEVVISSVHHAGAGGPNDFPTESVSLNYGKIDWTYTQQKRKDGSGGGNVTGKYDVTAGKA
jgi:type VI secretion system secreted protein Hcp